jgi:hypothetical protein
MRRGARPGAAFEPDQVEAQALAGARPSWHGALLAIFSYFR